MATKKRSDYITWDEYFMGVSLISAERSKDPNTQVGACIVNEKKRIIGIGYNGFPKGCSDEELPWDREAKSPNDTKYPYIVHAEANAILNSTKELDGATIYVALFPCNECTKLIIQSGIKEIVYLSDKYAATDPVKASKRMLDMAEVKFRELEAKRDSITVRFKNI
jgi:dCMP deaminase